MSLTNYADLQTSVATWLQRTDLTATLPDFITLFESFANRTLRVRQQEAVAILRPGASTAIAGAGVNLTYGPLGEVVLLVGDGSASSVASFTSGDLVTVAAIVGTTEANGSWPIQVVTSGSSIGRLVLLGTTFANSYVSGGTVTDGARTLPSDYLAWRRLTFQGNPKRELEYVEPSWLQSAFPTNVAEIPSVFTIENGVLTVAPADTTPLVFLYYQKIPSLAASSTNWLMTAHPDLYLFGTLTEAQAYAVNVDSAALWKARRDELIDEIIKLSNRTRGAGAIRVMSPTP